MRMPPDLTAFISSQTQLLLRLVSYSSGCTPSVAESPAASFPHTASAATIPLFMAVWVPWVGVQEGCRRGEGEAREG